MKAKSVIKIILDLALVGLFVILLFAYKTGLPFHEIMGISISLFVILHITLNWKWVSRVSKNLYSKIKLSFHKIVLSYKGNQSSDNMPFEGRQTHKEISAKTKTFWMYVLDFGVLFGLILIVVTGILISQVLFPGGLFNEFLFQLHRWTAYVTVGLMGIHLLLHWKYLASMFKAILTKLKSPTVSQALSESFAVLMVVALVYTGVVSNVQYAYDDRFYIPSDGDTYADDVSRRTNERLQQREAQRQQYLILAEEKRQKNAETINALRVASKETTLQNFLGGMFCTLCARFCPLTALSCGMGRSEAREAERVYQQIADIRI